MVDTDRRSRQVKAEKIASILQDIWKGRLAETRCLDLGCGIGVIADRLSQETRRVVAMDFERSLVSRVPSRLARLQGDGLRLPFSDAAFDVVICAQVYEHVADPVQLAAEITRVLKPGGICYFSGPNRLWPYEYHYRAWFIHWLPRKWLQRMLHLLGGDRSASVTLYTYWQLRQLWAHFEVRDYAVHLIRDAERFPGAGAPRWMRSIPPFVLRMLTIVIPNVNWVLSKPTDERVRR